VDHQLFLLHQHKMFAQGRLSSPATHSGMPPAPPCRPEAHLLPSGDKAPHSTPPSVCPHLLAPPCRLDGAWENYLPTLPLLQPRLVLCSGQGQKPKVPTQRHHSLSQHGRPTRARRFYTATHLPPPNRLPDPSPRGRHLLRPPQVKC